MISFFSSNAGFQIPIPVINFSSKTPASTPIYVWDGVQGHAGTYPIINDATITISYSTTRFSSVSSKYINVYYSTNNSIISTLNNTVFNISGTLTITGLVPATTYYIKAVNDYNMQSVILTATT